MTTHILAVHTYGAHRVNDPQTGKRISAQKIGYLSAAADLLLALYGEQARDVSSTRASYRYIQIRGETSVRYGYLLLGLTDMELAQAEAVAKLASRAGAYLYRDERWHELPNQSQPEYSTLPSTSRPNFDPRGYRLVSPSSGTKLSANNGITVEKSQRDPAKKAWFWLRGDTYPHRALLKQHGGRWSRKRKAWYIIAWELPDAIQQLVDDSSTFTEDGSPPDDDAPCSDDEAERILGVKLLSNAASPSAAPAESDATDDDTEAARPSIRVMQPPTMSDEPDEIQRAIQQTKVAPVKTVSQPCPTATTRWQLPQAICGELTGSITGQVWCYGWALYQETCVFVSMGGPRTAVEAIRAKFSKGDIVNLVPDDAPAIELTAGEGNTGMYTDYLHNIPEAKFASLMLAHEWLTEPNYGGKSTTFIFHLSDAQARAQLRHHVTELVNVPIFETWTEYLWQAGQSAKLLRKTRSNDCLTLWTVDLDVDAWTRLITGGLAEGIIQLPAPA